jgi:hypothetical protein
MRRLLLPVLLVALVAGLAVPVAAHPPATGPGSSTADLEAPAVSVVSFGPALTQTLTSGAPDPTTPWVAMVVTGMAALAVAWRPRRAVALTLVLVAAVLAFETGVHSAHHLGQADEAARCVVAGVSSHLSADVVHATADAPPVHGLQARIASCAPVPVAARLLAPDAGRAPPVLSV